MSQNNPIVFEVDNDSDLKKYVRGITGYDPTPSELPDSDLETQIALSKANLSLAYDLSGQPWFEDDGLAMALLYGCAIYCKITVENYSVASWDFGDEEIETSQLAPDESAQLIKWKSRVEDSIDNSDNTNVQNQTPSPSLTFTPNW